MIGRDVSVITVQPDLAVDFVKYSETMRDDIVVFLSFLLLGATQS
jgi:hypothetical protein